MASIIVSETDCEDVNKQNWLDKVFHVSRDAQRNTLIADCANIDEGQILIEVILLEQAAILSNLIPNSVMIYGEMNYKEREQAMRPGEYRVLIVTNSVLSSMAQERRYKKRFNVLYSLIPQKRANSVGNKLSLLDTNGIIRIFVDAKIENFKTSSALTLEHYRNYGVIFPDAL